MLALYRGSAISVIGICLVSRLCLCHHSSAMLTGYRSSAISVIGICLVSRLCLYHHSSAMLTGYRSSAISVILVRRMSKWISIGITAYRASSCTITIGRYPSVSFCITSNCVTNRTSFGCGTICIHKIVLDGSFLSAQVAI